MSKAILLEEQENHNLTQKLKRYDSIIHDQIISEQKIVKLNTKINKIQENNLSMK